MWLTSPVRYLLGFGVDGLQNYFPPAAGTLNRQSRQEMWKGKGKGRAGGEDRGKLIINKAAGSGSRKRSWPEDGA